MTRTMESQSCQLLIVQCGVLLRFVNAEGNDRMEDHAPMNNEELPTLGFRERGHRAGMSACK